MKKLLITTACCALCFFMSCKPGMDETSQAAKNKANSQEIYKAMETGDVSKLDAIIDKDFVDHSGEKGDVKGIDSLKKMFVQMHNEITGLKVEEIANATDGDYNIALVRMTGTTAKPMMNMPAGTKIDMKSVEVVKVKDGKAIEHWGYMDPKDMMQMMGAGMDHKMEEKMDK
ncbi:MAG: ester cyclase [Ginsengibacter sp.]